MRRLILGLLLAAGTAAADVTVTTSDDNVVDDGLCSLREAILAANTDASNSGCARTGGVGADVIDFDIGTGIPTIVVEGSDLPNLTGVTTIDGGTGGATRVEISGGGALTRGVSFLGATNASGSIVRSLVVNGFTSTQLLLSNGSNIVVEDCLLGVDPTGTSAKNPGSQGIEICNGFGCGTSQGHRIGGTGLTQHNLIVATGTGITVNGSNVTIQGNFIGTDIAGNVALAPSMTGISLQNVFNTMIGGTQ